MADLFLCCCGGISYVLLSMCRADNGYLDHLLGIDIPCFGAMVGRTAVEKSQ